MGPVASSFRRLLSRRTRNFRILILGLDASGKTSILYQLICGLKLSTIPTIGFNAHSVKFRNIEFSMWDIGGQDSIRALWRHYYRGSEALVYVVDSTDTDRLSLSAEELHTVLGDREMEAIPVLVFANKQDHPKAVSVQEVEALFDLGRYADRPTRVIGTCAHTGLGLQEGLGWLSEHISVQ